MQRSSKLAELPDWRCDLSWSMTIKCKTKIFDRHGIDALHTVIESGNEEERGLDFLPNDS